MARKILISYDFSKLELLNTRLQNLAADPGSPVMGQFYYNTADNTFRWHNGTAFVSALTTAHAGTGGTAHANAVAAGAAGFMTGADKTKLDGVAAGATANSADATLLARANHTGTQLAATIGDFNTAVRTNALNQMGTPTADVSVGSFKLTNVANGTSAQDAATYGQLLEVQNGTDWKQSVRALSTANVALSGLQTVDGITLVANDRVALVGQSIASQNGIYVAASGAWTRSLDADANTEVTPNCTFMVEEGTTNADTQWRLTTNGAISLGSTALTFAQIGAGTSYTQGNGIAIGGSVIGVDVTVVVRKFAQTVGDNSSTSIAVTHNLGSQDVTVSIRDASTHLAVDCDWTATSTNVVTLGFAAAPATNSLRVTVHA